MCGVTLTIAASVVPSIRVFVIAAGVISLVISGRKNSEKPLLFAVLLFGFAPTLGWLGQLNRNLDVVVLASAFAISTAMVNLCRRQTRFQFWLIPPAISGCFTYFWWSPITRGTQQEILSRLLTAWDHFGHFYLYVSATVNSKFIALLPNTIAETTVYNKRYPAGIHMAWSQWWRQDGSTLSVSPSLGLQMYSRSVVLTVAVCTVLMILSIARIASRKRTKIIVTTVSSIMMTSIGVFGPLSLGIWSGFPNFVAAVTGVVIVGSVALRPTSSPWSTLLILAGGALMCSYNWFPIIAPVMLIAVTSLLLQMTKLYRKEKYLFVGAAFVLGILILLPVVNSLSLGAKHLVVDGGIQPLRPDLILLVFLFGIIIGCHHLRRHSDLHGILRASPLFLAPLFQIAVTVPIRIQKGTYPYYPQKLAYGMVFVVLATAAIILVENFVDTEEFEEKRLRLSGAIGIIGVAIFGTQLFGYVGPDWAVLAPQATATGLANHHSTVVSTDVNHSLALTLLNLNRSTSEISDKEKDCLLLLEERAPRYEIVLANYWVGSLNGTLTEEHLLRSQRLVPILTDANFRTLTAELIDKYLEPEKDCPVIPQGLSDELIARNEKWRDWVWTIESDGRILKYSGKE
jgi:hypothetical protein